MHITRFLICLALAVATRATISPTDSSYAPSVLAVQDTVNRYPLALDSKVVAVKVDPTNFESLSNVFTRHVVADYSPPLGILTGLASIQNTLSDALVIVTTQHALTTQVVTLVSKSLANTTTYFTATHFGVDGSIFARQVYTVYGRYEDQLVLTKQGWRINKRNVIYTGSAVFGNGTLVPFPDQ
ncbi:hypothetical protein FPV67DRAFT_1738507 [Lyophyllum atratum]|nr:hypothetical protein FPV67DRAFT_1738507 [Lyophyllum atratum]